MVVSGPLEEEEEDTGMMKSEEMSQREKKNEEGKSLKCLRPAVLQKIDE